MDPTDDDRNVMGAEHARQIKSTGIESAQYAGQKDRPLASLFDTRNDPLDRHRAENLVIVFAGDLFAIVKHTTGVTIEQESLDCGLRLRRHDRALPLLNITITIIARRRYKGDMQCHCSAPQHE